MQDFANKNAIYADFLHKWHEKRKCQWVGGFCATSTLPHFHIKKRVEYKLENLKSNPELIDRRCGVLLTRAQ